MNEKFTKATGLTFAAFVALVVGLQWDSFFKGLAGFPALVQAWSAGLPFGFWSFMLALVVGMGVWAAIFAHPSVCKYRPHSCADSLSVGTGLCVNIGQQAVIGVVTPGSMLTAMWLGLFAGLLAMFLARLGWSFFATPKEPKS